MNTLASLLSSPLLSGGNPHVLTPADSLRRKRARDHSVTAIPGDSKLFVVGDT